MPGKKTERDKKIGRNIQAARKAAKIGQAELGRILGLESSTSMWRFENGWRISADKLELIARTCRVTVDELLRGAGPAEDEPDRKSITPTQADILRIVQQGLEAAQDGSAAALAEYDKRLIEHLARRGRLPKAR